MAAILGAVGRAREQLIRAVTARGVATPHRRKKRHGSRQTHHSQDSSAILLSSSPTSSCSCPIHVAHHRWNSSMGRSAGGSSPRARHREHPGVAAASFRSTTSTWTCAETSVAEILDTARGLRDLRLAAACTVRASSIPRRFRGIMCAGALPRLDDTTDSRKSSLLFAHRRAA